MSGPEVRSVLGGPSFEPAESKYWRARACDACGRREEGAHYSIFGLQGNDDHNGMAALRDFFPDGKANDLNFVLFSTSGVHGSYTTLEEIEASLRKYPEPMTEDEANEHDDHCRSSLTFLVVQPRIVALRYGNADVTLDDIPFLKTLRDTSHAAMAKIGTVDA